MELLLLSYYISLLLPPLSLALIIESVSSILAIATFRGEHFEQF